MKVVLSTATALLLVSSCAPKGVKVDESELPTQPTVAEKKPEVPATDDSLPNFVPNDGLLDPMGLTTMPTEKDMQPTVGPLDPGKSTVIANPPTADETTTE